MKTKNSFFRFLNKNWPLLTAGAVVLVFVLYQFSLMSSNALSTQVAIKSTVYESESAQAVFLREEQALEDVDGVVVQNVEDGGKVAKGGEVAKVFGDQATAENYTKLLQLQQKLDYFNELKSMTLGEATGIDSMNSAIHQSINSIVRNKNTNSLEPVGSYTEELNDLLIRRQILVGEEVDFDEIIAELTTQIEALEKSGTLPKSTVTTETSGNFSSSADGFESYYDYTQIEQMTVEDVTKAIDETLKPNETKSMGKVINGFKWYIACVMDSSVVASFKPEDTVSVVLVSDASVVINAKVAAKNVESVTAEKTALILSCDEMNEKLSNLRNEKVEIRLKAYTGLRIDSRAIKIEEKQRGVYALLGNKIVFRKIEEIYSGDGFVIAKINNEDNKNVQLYDNVIVQGKDLYDGKFIN